MKGTAWSPFAEPTRPQFWASDMVHRGLGKELSHGSKSPTMLTGPYKARSVVAGGQRAPLERIKSAWKDGKTSQVARRGIPSAWHGCCSKRWLLHTLLSLVRVNIQIAMLPRFMAGDIVTFMAPEIIDFEKEK